MTREGNTFNKIAENLKHRYRLVVMNEETFEEVGSYKLTWLNVYIAVCTVLVVVVTLVILVFVFTPVKQYLPGYGDVDQLDYVRQLERRVSSLEREMNAREVYIKSVRNALTANVKYKPTSVSDEDLVEVTDSLINLEPIAEDYELREAVEREELLGGTSTTAVTTRFKVKQRSIESLHFVAPLKGAISDDFRPDRNHFGIDVIAPRNTPVKTIADGTVITSEWTYETGNVVAVQHDNNLVSFYKHNSILLKKVGSFVRAGEAVAIIGNTGELTNGPHLHFELWHHGKPINPSEYINFN